MRKTFKFAAALLLIFALVMSLAACGTKQDTPETTDTEAVTDVPEQEAQNVIELSGSAATLDGKAVEEFDYTWHCDPSEVHEDVKDAPAEYYTGTAPETDAAVYIDSELYYYPSLPEDGFKQVNYDGETEWAYYYTDGENGDYIFATLPNLGGKFPSDMMHTEEEAAGNRVLHITKAGTYTLRGQWNGQIKIDLGDEDETFTDENAKVTLILDGADIKCTVAPGIVFDDLYECDNTWEDADEHPSEVDTSNAGVTLVIADGSENTVDGKNVFRMLKTKYKDEDSTDAVKVQKKMRKTDGALYSYVTMNIVGGEKGDGALTVTSGFEGIDSELHLSVLGGNITVNSQDDGMNVNEDNVSVISFLGGSVTLNAALGAEGDGVDSNGFIVIDGGNLSVNGIRVPDNALDSEDGITYKSGTVTVDGEALELTAGTQYRELPEMGGGMGQPGDMRPGAFEDFDIKEFKEKVAALDDDATIDDVLEILGMGGFGGERPEEIPQGGNMPAPPDGEMQQPPQGGERPEMPDGQMPEPSSGEAPATPTAQ